MSRDPSLGERRRNNPFWSQAERTSLVLRMGHLLALRAGFGLVVMGSGVLAPELLRVPASKLVFPTVVYLVISVTIEAAREGSEDRGLPLVVGSVLVDALYLQWAMYMTGWTESVLVFLVYVQLVAVTLLTSYRMGIKLAVWHSVIFFLGSHAQSTGLLEPAIQSGDAVTTWLGQQEVFRVVAFWVVVLGTAAFSAVNERELRKGKAHFQALARIAAELDHARDPRMIASILLDAVRDALGFSRALVIGASEGEFTVIAARGMEAPEGPTLGVDSLVRRAWAERQPVLVRKVDARANPQLAALIPDARKVVVVPLIADDYPLGVLVFEHRSRFKSRIERRVLSVIGQFASHAALALRNAWLLETIRTIADTDPLTGLANRRAFEQALERELARAQRTAGELTLLLVDIDHFKEFNDRYGHQAGDEALRAVADALVSASRSFDTVARYGGEELAVILPACPWSESIAAGERLRAAVSDIEALGGLTVSIGVAIYPTHGLDAASLIGAADWALYGSKAGGRNRVTLADDVAHDALEPLVEGGAPELAPAEPQTGNGVARLVGLRSDLEKAVERHELRVRYQPIVDLRRSGIVGFEALVRWEHPARGLLPPAEFLPLAEETGLIMGIDQWVLHQACRQMKEWQESDPDLFVTVNLSGWELERPESVRAVSDALRASELQPESLIIEITESVLISNMEATLRWLQQLKLLGVRFAIDDFGSGYSSLKYLRHFPVDILKIDKSFIEGIANTEEDSLFAKALVELAHVLRKKPIAEGIESRLQHSELDDLGCEMGQGYLFAAPLDRLQAEALLSSSMNRARHRARATAGYR